jgi:hypothetical protein
LRSTADRNSTANSSPAESGDDVVRSHASRQAGRDLLQQLVTGEVAEAVVDHLEVVEVDEQHGQGGVVGGLAQRRRRAFGEQGAVAQPGEAVVGGLVPQTVATALERLRQAEDAQQDQQEQRRRHDDRDRAVGRRPPEQVDHRHAERGDEHDHQLSAGEPALDELLGDAGALRVRVQRRQAEQHVEAEPEEVDVRAGLERALGVVEAVRRVGDRERTERADHERERAVPEVQAHHEPGGHREQGDVHHRVGDLGDQPGDRVERRIDHVVDPHDPHGAEDRDADHGRVDEARVVAPRRHLTQHPNQPDDHQRVHAEVEEVGDRRERRSLLTGDELEHVVADVGDQERRQTGGEEQPRRAVLRTVDADAHQDRHDGQQARSVVEHELGLRRLGDDEIYEGQQGSAAQPPLPEIPHGGLIGRTWRELERLFTTG